MFINIRFIVFCKTSNSEILNRTMLHPSVLQRMIKDAIFVQKLLGYLQLNSNAMQKEFFSTMYPTKCTQKK